MKALRLIALALAIVILGTFFVACDQTEIDVELPEITHHRIKNLSFKIIKSVGGFGKPRHSPFIEKLYLKAKSQ